MKLVNVHWGNKLYILTRSSLLDRNHLNFYWTEKLQAYDLTKLEFFDQ